MKLKNLSGLILRVVIDVVLDTCWGMWTVSCPICIEVCAKCASLLSSMKGPLEPTREVAHQVLTGLAIAR